MHLILASQSPRRRELLSVAGYDFRVVEPSSTAESGDVLGEAPQELVIRLARQKAQDVAGRIDNGLVLGCDTVAECDGEILGKPTDRDDAAKMLRRMSGAQHRVYSGICLWRRPEEQFTTGSDVTHLIMDVVSDEQLERYLESGFWVGKAGAFGYQDGLDWVHIEQGSETNVVGLPMELLSRMLRCFGD